MAVHPVVASMGVGGCPLIGVFLYQSVAEFAAVELVHVEILAICTGSTFPFVKLNMINEDPLFWV